MTLMGRLRAALWRLWSVIGARASDDDFSRELDAHVQLHVDENIARGMSPGAARREALMTLGGVEQTKALYRERRGIPAVEHLARDLRHAIRALAKRPILVATTTISIAVGVGINVAIYGAPTRLRRITYGRTSYVRTGLPASRQSRSGCGITMAV